MKRTQRLLGMAALLGACDVPSELAPEAQVADGALIYGSDHRVDVYQLTNPDLTAAANSTVGLVGSRDLSRNADGTYTLSTGGTLRQAVGVCSSEAYASQPVAPDCSGFQVGPDRIATAGHCISSSSCASTRFVFGFHMVSSSSARTRVAANDVYSCAQVLGRETGSTKDWAVVRVDRPIVGHEPLAIRRSGKVASGTDLILIGHPSGLPTKVAGGATVRDNSPTSYFSANLDSYGGNSGSAVLNAGTLEVEGILVRGNNDYVWSGGCYRSAVCNDSGCPGWEDATRASLMASVVPELVPPAPAFSMTGPVLATAGSAITFDVEGASPGTLVWLITGASAGQTEVPGCPGVFADQTKVVALGSGIADVDGFVQITATAKPGWARRLREFSAVSLADCAVSPVVNVQF